jgi:Tat protein translocase TatB subunit
MFDVGFSELVLLFVIGLLVLGPEKLPKVATQIGRWVGRARRTASHLRHQLEREIALSELAESQKRRPSEPPKPAPSQPEPPSSAEPASPTTSTAAGKVKNPPPVG